MSTADELVEWGNPPPKHRGGKEGPHPWKMVAAILRANPGKWARIDKQAPSESLGPRINRGKSVWAPAGSYKAVQRNIDGRIYTWAHYCDSEGPCTHEGPSTVD